MTTEEIIYIATKTFDKGWDYETMMYGDDMYGNESFADEVWEYVTELKENGRKSFYEKYKHIKLY